MTIHRTEEKKKNTTKSRGGGGGVTPLCDFNGDVRPDRIWFSGCFVLNGVSISSLSVLTGYRCRPGANGLNSDSMMS